VQQRCRVGVDVAGSVAARFAADVGGDVPSDVPADVDGGVRVRCMFVVMRPHLALGLAFLAIVVDGCNCRKDADAPGGPPRLSLEELVPQRVPDTDLILALPKGWLVQRPNPGPLPAPPPAGAKIELRTRVLLSAGPGTPAKGTLVAAKLLVLEDPWLPVGTTGVDYLVAQRAANQAVIGANIRHVDAEPSRRQGRPSYHVRDEWTVEAGGMKREVAQEALLLLDDARTPDGQAGMHGYTVVITLEKPEFLQLQPLLRDIFASARFEERAPRDAGPG
jgi:hypothetical protein